MTRQVIQISFTVTCWIVFMLMVIYWLYKYKVEDRDIGVLDLLSLEEAKDVDFPMPSICILYPFLKKQFNNTHSNKSSDVYLDYLKGNIFADFFVKVDYEKATLNLGDYFLFATEKWKNDTDTLINSTLDVKHVTTFSGFNSKDDFFKCFSIQIDLSNHRHIRTIGFHYAKARLLEDWIKNPDPENNWSGYDIHRFGIKFNWQGQFLIGDEPDFWDYLNIDEYDSIEIWIYNLEVIKRRSTSNKRCLNNYTAHDQSLMTKYVSQKGCRVPYVKGHDSFRFCNSSSDTRKAKLTLGKTKTINLQKPCNRISKLSFEDTVENKHKDWNQT